jgi:exodeoxyribonuclease V gamma subunit
VRHPLQPFDPRNFTRGALVGGRPWSFDRVTVEGARALVDPRAERRPFLAGPLPDAAAPVIEVDELVRFVQHPVRAFLRRRLGISVADFSEEVEDALAVELDHLGRWDVGQRLLDGVLAGASVEACVEAEIARGTLPPGRLAGPVLASVRPTVEEIARHAAALLPAGASPGSLDVRVGLDDGRALGGTVPGVWEDVLRTVGFSRVAAKHRLAAWVRWLALTAAHPERPFAAATVGRVRAGADGAQVTIARLAPLGPDAASRRASALGQLTTLVDLHDRGMREPLPIACQASAAYARAAATGANPVVAGRAAWESSWSFEREDAEPEHQLAFGGVLSFDELLAATPRPDEHGDSWEAGDPTRFGRYARRLWQGPLGAETVVDR